MALTGSRADAVHDSACPDIGPICAIRAEPPQQHHTRLWIGELRLVGEYGLRPGLAVQGLVPFRTISTTTRYTDLAGRPVTLDYANIHHHDGVRAGVGDVQLLLHGSVARGRLQLGARAGASLPTGTVHENPYRLGDMGLPHEHLQFGTGTFDPVAGVDVAALFSRLSVAGFAQAQVPLYEGRHGYQAGARFLGGAVLSGWRASRAVIGRLGVFGVHERAERWDGAVPTEDGNQGRSDLFVGPGITLPFWSDYSVSLDARVRVWGRAVNAQLDLPVVVDLSFGRLLHLERGPHVEQGGGGSGGDGDAPAVGDIGDAVLAGEAATLNPVAGKWTVFDFWATWCEACKKLDAELRALADAEPRLAVRRINIVDLDSPIARAELRGVELLPHIRLVGPDGRVAWEGSGPPAELLREVRRRLSP